MIGTSPMSEEGDGTVQALIAVDGRDADRESLWDWLRRDPDLRGRLRLSASQGLPDAMGASSDLLLQLGVATVGAGTIWAALARSISTWLVQRRSDLTVSVTGPDGRTVRLSAKRVADAERLLRTVLESDESAAESRSDEEHQ